MVHVPRLEVMPWKADRHALQRLQRLQQRQRQEQQPQTAAIPAQQADLPQNAVVPPAQQARRQPSHLACDIASIIILCVMVFELILLAYFQVYVLNRVITMSQGVNSLVYSLVALVFFFYQFCWVNTLAPDWFFESIERAIASTPARKLRSASTYG